MRKLAIIDKNPNAHLTQWRAAPEPKKFFHNPRTLANDVRKYNPDYIFINKGNTFPLEEIQAAIWGYRSVYFYGDYYRPIPNYVMELAKICSAVVLTNKDKGLWGSLGNDRIYFVSQGADTEIFKPVKLNTKYAVVFPGNYYGTKFLGSDIRLKLVRWIQKAGYNFLAVGNGWPEDVNSIPRQPVHKLNTIINQSKITVGMSHFVDVPCYTSNRLYQCMATGVPHIAWYSPGVKDLFSQGYREVNSYSELHELMLGLLLNGKARLEMGTAQYSEIHLHHTIFHVWENIEKIMEAL